MDTTTRRRKRATAFRRAGWLAVASMVAVALAGPSASSVIATGQSVNICHATNSDTNPYVFESPAMNANGAFAGQLSGGHNSHTGPIWYDGAKAAHVQWGDIIPPYTYAPTGFSYPGLNWTAAGQAIWNAGCNIPTTTTTTTTSGTTTEGTTTSGTTSGTTTSARRIRHDDIRHDDIRHDDVRHDDIRDTTTSGTTTSGTTTSGTTTIRHDDIRDDATTARRAPRPALSRRRPASRA